ncbi:hypothetical protein [Tepidimonas sp.]|uniref:hypothetical protein n=1 Tax=Tepidimonas sp. TaxID=2002775 RepID=UPI002FE0DD0E
MWLHAPFDPAIVDQINRLQAGVVPMPVYPLTCPQAKDGHHSFAGGYLGVLVAHRNGLVCPSCGYTQTWIGRAALACAEREDPCPTQRPSARMEKARQQALQDFGRLVRTGQLSAQAMVESLHTPADGPIGTPHGEAAPVLERLAA